MHNELNLISEKGAAALSSRRGLVTRNPYVGPAIDYKYGVSNDQQIWVPSNMSYGAVPEGY